MEVSAGFGIGIIIEVFHIAGILQDAKESLIGAVR